MKIFIILCVVSSIIVWGISCSRQPSERKMLIGTIDNIDGNIEKLMNSSLDDSFLVIQSKDNEDFIQLTGGIKGVQLDFPLITEKQKKSESTFRNTCKELNLNIIENKGSDGTVFLDVDINGTTSEVANVIKKFAIKFLNVNSKTNLQFDLNV